MDTNDTDSATYLKHQVDELQGKLATATAESLKLQKQYLILRQQFDALLIEKLDALIATTGSPMAQP